MQPDTDTTARTETDTPAAEGVTVAVDTDGPGPGDDGTYVPPMLYCVFGLPIFLTLIWFFLRFTRPDRFGRVDRDPTTDDAPDDDGPPDDSAGETEGDIADDPVTDDDDELPPAS